MRVCARAGHHGAEQRDGRDRCEQAVAVVRTRARTSCVTRLFCIFVFVFVFVLPRGCFHTACFESPCSRPRARAITRGKYCEFWRGNYYDAGFVLKEMQASATCVCCAVCCCVFVFRVRVVCARAYRVSTVACFLIHALDPARHHIKHAGGRGD